MPIKSHKVFSVKAKWFEMRLLWDTGIGVESIRPNIPD